MATVIIKDSITSEQARVINGKLQVDATVTATIVAPLPLPVEVENFPTSFGATQVTSPWVISGDVTVTNASIAVTGPLTDVQLRAAPVPIGGTVAVSNFPATQPVSGTVSATQSGVWNITNVTGSISLPTGAATDTTLSGVLTTTAFQARVNTLGQKTRANSTPVVLASDQTAIPVFQSTSTAAVTSSSVTNASSQIIGSNVNRKGLIITNAAGNAVFLSFASPAATTNYAIQLGASIGTDSFQMFPVVYTGAIFAVRGSGNGTVVVTEFT